MKRIYNNINLANRNSFGVVESAATLVEFDTVEELREYFTTQRPATWYVLGAGNNTLFTKFYDGALIVPKSGERTILSDDGERGDVRVEAAHDWDELVAWSVEQGLWGIENLSAIPSSVGAAPVQNIGAYGAEAKDAITVVEYFDTRTMEIVRLSNEECRFAYRESIFKQELKGVAIILAVEFRLSREPKPNLGYGDVIKEVEARGGATLTNIREAICAIRGSKLPDPKVLGNAGSFFTNPVIPRTQYEALKTHFPNIPSYPIDEERVKVPAGWLIDSAGWKGRALGRAAVHDRQALVLVNLGGATGKEVMALAERICEEVHNKYSIHITPEVNFISCE